MARRTVKGVGDGGRPIYTVEQPKENHLREAEEKRSISSLVDRSVKLPGFNFVEAEMIEKIGQDRGDSDAYELI